MSTAEKQAATTHNRTSGRSPRSVCRHDAMPLAACSSRLPTMPRGRPELIAPGGLVSAGSSRNTGASAASAKNAPVAAKIFGKPSGSASHGPRSRAAAMMASTLPTATLTTIARPRCPGEMSLPCRAASTS